VLALLPAGSFIQTHKSYVVAKDKVDLIREQELVIGPHCIPVSSHRRSRIIHELTQWAAPRKTCCHNHPHRGW
jgi:DNA-binding LytR/AlgR family response regulator